MTNRDARAAKRAAQAAKRREEVEKRRREREEQSRREKEELERKEQMEREYEEERRRREEQRKSVKSFANHSRHSVAYALLINQSFVVILWGIKLTLVSPENTFAVAFS